MRRGWKRVAERGDKHSYAANEICAALVPALQQDCRAELGQDFLNGLRRVCLDQENSLFKDEMEPQLRALRATAGSGIGRVVLDHAIQLSAAGEQGLSVAEKALTNALNDRACRGARQVEEHYFRESTAPRAHRVRERIEQAIGISAEPIKGLARQMLRIESEASPRPQLKLQGIDDGVSL